MNNKLIAEFMKVNIITIDDVIKNKNPYYSSADGYLEEDLKYHLSWDWLMPVVEKIESFGFEFIIAESRCKIKHNTDHSIEELFHIETIGSKFKTIYETVVEFIKNYKTTYMKDNKLIAEFMGMTVDNDDKSMMIFKTSQGNDIIYIDELKYHLSWDWLMPVVEEIDHLNYEPIDTIEKALSTRLIKDSHKAVVQFIKNYKTI